MVKIDATNDIAYVWRGASADTLAFYDSIDISSLVGNFKITLHGTGAASAATRAGFYWFRTITGSETTTVTESFSSNAGTNYTTASSGLSLITSTERGFETVAKLVTTPVTGEGIVVSRIDYLAHVI